MRFVTLVTGTAYDFHCIPDDDQSENTQRCNLYGNISMGNDPGKVEHQYKDRGYKDCSYHAVKLWRTRKICQENRIDMAARKLAS